MSALLLAAAVLSWSELPSLPQPLGGQLVGTIGDELLVAGGTYWKGTPWTGGTKYWVDTVYALDAPNGKWRVAGRLPEPLAYGVSVSIPGAMLLIGGQSDKETHGKVWRLRLQQGKAVVEPMPRLPCACGWMSAAVLGDAVYVGGGGEGFPGASKALRRFWKLELNAVSKGWVELEPWKGPATFFAVMAAVDGGVYLAGGADLADGKRVFLKQAYRYTPGTGWKRIADLPVALQGGYAAAGRSGLLVIGGNDGVWADREQDPKHPGFRREVFAYDARQDKWSEAGKIPASLVTSGLTVWQGRIVIAGGEDRPASRSARVIAAPLAGPQ